MIITIDKSQLDIDFNAMTVIVRGKPYHIQRVEGSWHWSGFGVTHWVPLGQSNKPIEKAYQRWLVETILLGVDE